MTRSSYAILPLSSAFGVVHLLRVDQRLFVVDREILNALFQLFDFPVGAMVFQEAIKKALDS